MVKILNRNLESKEDLLEKNIAQLFENEREKKDSIFIRIDKSIAKSITAFATKKIDRCAAIGIAGETASGKSTITKDIIDTIKDFEKERQIENIIDCIKTDDYYYDRSEMVKYWGSFAKFVQNYDLDTPDAIELDLMYKHISLLLKGQTIRIPKYDMSGTAKRIDNFQLKNPSKIIISEGLFTFNEKIHKIFDFKIYVDIDSKTQKIRFFDRAKQRNLGECANNVYNNATQKAKRYIQPTAKYAHIILSGKSDRQKYKEFVSNLLHIIWQYNQNHLETSK